MDELKIPEDLKEMYRVQKSLLRSFRDEEGTVEIAKRTIALIERIAKLQAALTKAEAEANHLDELQSHYTKLWADEVAQRMGLQGKLDAYIAAQRRIAVLERALLIKARRDELPGDVITPQKRVRRWIEDAEESLKPVDAKECI